MTISMVSKYALEDVACPRNQVPFVAFVIDEHTIAREAGGVVPRRTVDGKTIRPGEHPRWTGGQRIEGFRLSGQPASLRRKPDVEPTDGNAHRPR